MKLRLAIVSFSALVQLALCASPVAAQRTAHEQLTRDIYAELIGINTTDTPAGDNTKAAEAMAARLLAAGYDSADVQVLAPAPRKGNLVARLRGTGQRKPLLLLAHLDVVTALREDWSLDPFVLTERDGWYYGRGTSDDKAMAAIFTATMIRLKREGYRPDRDIILALTADEEGGDHNGVAWLLAGHRDLVDAAYAINEGGGGALRNGKPLMQGLQAAEKRYSDFTVTVHNKGGHSSVPVTPNAIYQLLAGLGRLAGFTFPIRLNPVTTSSLERLALVSEPELARAMKALAANPADTAAERVVSSVPSYNASLRTTCVATMLSAGHAPNALPQTASANVNCRIIPGETPESVRAELVRVFADTAIEVSEGSGGGPSDPSPLTPEVMDAVERLTEQMWPGTPVVPTMSNGATDGRHLRAAGIPTYGVSGLFGEIGEGRAHGRDERMSVKSFEEGTRFLESLVRVLSGGKPAM